MDKLLTNRKTFLASMGSLLLAGPALAKKEVQAPVAKSNGYQAEPLPMQAVKARHTRSRGGNAA